MTSIQHRNISRMAISSPTYTEPRLPLEVVNQIIDDLAKHNDKLSSIKACALVCHSFLLLCRKHIFASVTLNAQQSFSPSLSPTSDDLNHLLSNSPHLAVYVLNLDYRVNKNEFVKERILWLLPMFKKLIKLQSLRISYMLSRSDESDWMSSSERKVLLPLLHFLTLTSISLTNIKNFPIADLAGCVNLKRLEIHSLKCSPNGVGTFLETLPPTPAMLERLVINTGNVKPVQLLCDAQRPDGKPIIDFSSLKEIKSNDVQLYSMTKLFGMCKNLHKVALVISMFPPHLTSSSI